METVTILVFWDGVIGLDLLAGRLLLAGFYWINGFYWIRIITYLNTKIKNIDEPIFLPEREQDYIE